MSGERSGRSPGAVRCTESVRRAARVYPRAAFAARPGRLRLRPRGGQFQRSQLHDRHRGGADDPRRRVARPRQRGRVAARGRRDSEQVKPELMESVLEIATSPQPERRRRRGASCARCGPRSPRRRPTRGLAIGSAGTHPFAMWEDQRIVARERYRDLVSDLRFVARQELLFGQHVHVGLDDREKAIHVANGMRVHLPVLLALSANSPFWRGDATGLASTRTPIFRAFPRVGIPPTYDGLGRLRGEHRVHGRERRDRGLHVPLVRRAPAPEPRDGRDPRDGRRRRASSTRSGSRR